MADTNEVPVSDSAQAPSAGATDNTSTAEPIVTETTAEEELKSDSVTLADLCAKATALYAHKSYEESAEVYAKAAELQAEMRGEMEPENAEILFLYGRSLFKVGQAKSDVLGGKAAAADEAVTASSKKAKSGANGKRAAAVAGPSNGSAAQETGTARDRITEEGVALIATGAAAPTAQASTTEEVPEAKKPLFQFTGDENFDDSDEEEGDDAEGGDEEEEEEEDLAVAFEILDLARVLFDKRLENFDNEAAAQNGKGKDKAEQDDLLIRHIKERLADTHDLLAEISLENERYPNAIVDSRKSLEYKMELHPEESEVIAEAHFKLSLALEFASVTTAAEDGDQKPSDGASAPHQVDEKLRAEAVTELEAAIRSTKLKLQKKEVELATSHSPDENEITKKQIAECRELVADMEQRLTDLRSGPLDINAALGGAGALGGILGAALGETPAQMAQRVEEAKKNATDLTSVVRRKKRDEPVAEAPAAASSSNGTGKRKADDSDEDEGSQQKKVRVEDAPEE